MKKLISLILSCFFVILLYGQNEYLYTYHSVPEINYLLPEPSSKCKNGDQIVIISLEEAKTLNYPYLYCFLRIDSLGNIVWNTIIQNQIYSGSKIIEDDDGNFYYFSTIFPKACAIKFSKNGEVLWIKTYGSKYSAFADVAILSTGDLVALGEITKNNGVQTTYILKLNKDGDVIWEKATNFSQSGYGDHIIATDDGGCIITGVRDADLNYNGGRFVTKIDTNAKLLWIKSFGFDTSINKKILKTGANNYTIVGQGLQIILTNIDETGKINWSKRLPYKNGDFYEITNDAIIKGNNIIVGGGYLNAGYTMFLLNISIEGKINWLSIFPQNNSTITGIEPNSNQGFDLYGYFEEVSGTFKEYPFLMKTDSFGQIPCLSEIDYNPPLQVVDYPVMVDSGGTLITLNNPVVLETPIIRTDITFTKKVICESNATQNIHNNSSPLFTLYPNPTSSEITIELTPEYQVYGSKLQIEISDALGRRVSSVPVKHYENVVVPKGILSPGYYVVSVVSQSKVLQSQKLVVVE